MTIAPEMRIADRKLIVKDRAILTGIPENVLVTPVTELVKGVFIGAEFKEPESRHVTSLGTLRDVRFLACYRFKLWWMAQKMGNLGRQIPIETQFLLVESKCGSHFGSDGGVLGEFNDGITYTVFLPLIEGPFRTSLQGNTQDELELCLESGDEASKATSFTHALFVTTGTDPFVTITNAIMAVKLHLKTFKQRHEKKLPDIVNYFGWCTWDAFYRNVTQQGVETGLASLCSGGTPPKFVIIDDGWQSVAFDRDDQTDPVVARLIGIKENENFRIRDIVRIAKEMYGLKYVYVWHAITGYWGGVRPGVEGMEEYESSIKCPIVSEGVVENEPRWKTEGYHGLVMEGVGLVNPKSVVKFYNDLHGYLASNGIDGVKVDVQCILETLGEGFGGRVELTRRFHQALDESVAKNFQDNGCISCMSHNTDSLYCSKQTAMVRASDDFYPKDPVSHTIHIAAVVYNSMFMGEIMQPDWDMFQSHHPTAEYHGSARGISGGPVYVSDAPGKHNFDLLKKLVLPDGSILRARLPARPTKDCLFNDPTRDGVSLLKIWNMNKYTGVLGVYNCQGAAWSSIERKNTFHRTSTEAISSIIRGKDVHLITEASTNPDDWNGDCVAYRHRTGKLFCLPYNATLPISLKVLEYEIFIITPIRVLAPGFSFAPLGLINMFNGGGAIEDLRYEMIDTDARARVYVEVKGCGKFGAFSSAKPRRCTISSSEVDFSYDLASGLVVLQLDQMPDESKGVHVVKIEV